MNQYNDTSAQIRKHSAYGNEFSVPSVSVDRFEPQTSIHVGGTVAGITQVRRAVHLRDQIDDEEDFVRYHLISSDPTFFPNLDVFYYQFIVTEGEVRIKVGGKRHQRQEARSESEYHRNEAYSQATSKFSREATLDENLNLPEARAELLENEFVLTLPRIPPPGVRPYNYVSDAVFLLDKPVEQIDHHAPQTASNQLPSDFFYSRSSGLDDDQKSVKSMGTMHHESRFIPKLAE